MRAELLACQGEANGWKERAINHEKELQRLNLLITSYEEQLYILENPSKKATLTIGNLQDNFTKSHARLEIFSSAAPQVCCSTNELSTCLLESTNKSSKKKQKSLPVIIKTVIQIQTQSQILIKSILKIKILILKK